MGAHLEILVALREAARLLVVKRDEEAAIRAGPYRMRNRRFRGELITIHVNPLRGELLQSDRAEVQAGVRSADLVVVRERLASEETPERLAGYVLGALAPRAILLFGHSGPSNLPELAPRGRSGS